MRSAGVNAWATGRTGGDRQIARSCPSGLAARSSRRSIASTRKSSLWPGRCRDKRPIVRQIFRATPLPGRPLGCLPLIRCPRLRREGYLPVTLYWVSNLVPNATFYSRDDNPSIAILHAGL
jgi:hypothetical protein